MSGTDIALQMRGVRKTFEAENAPVRALRGVDLDIGRGEFVALDRAVRLRQVDAAQPGRRALTSPTRAASWWPVRRSPR